MPQVRWCERDLLQIGSAPIVRDRNSVATHVERLVVQWLMDITNKVNYKAHRIEQLGGAGARVLQLRGIVGDGAHDASTLAAVTVKVDTTTRGWRVIGIDEMKRLGPGSGTGVAVAVSPCGGVSHISRGAVIEGVLDKRRCLGGNKVLCNVGNGLVAHGAPGVDHTEA